MQVQLDVLAVGESDKSMTSKKKNCFDIRYHRRLYPSQPSLAAASIFSSAAVATATVASAIVPALCQSLHPPPSP
jgi:hypothetical protein